MNTVPTPQKIQTESKKPGLPLREKSVFQSHLLAVQKSAVLIMPNQKPVRRIGNSVEILRQNIPGSQQFVCPKPVPVPPFRSKSITPIWKNAVIKSTKNTSSFEKVPKKNQQINSLKNVLTKGKLRVN